MTDFIRWFEDIGIEDVPDVGGKNASLGEMYRELSQKGIRVPNGFAVTATALSAFPQRNRVGPADSRHPRGSGYAKHCQSPRTRPSGAGSDRRRGVPAGFAGGHRQRLTKQLGEGRSVDVAVRSSATAEDLPDASFAGQQETYLNVQGKRAVLDACRRCFASLFTDRAISYRVDRGFDHIQIALSIGVQRMVRSDLATSGVMFSIDTETGFREAVLINAAYGLGENVVQGAVNPDEIYVFKPTLKTGHRPILQKRMGNKEFKLVYDLGGGKMTKNVPVPPGDRQRFCVSDEDHPHACQMGLRHRRPLLGQARAPRADGHGMGQGWEDRGTVHRPSPPGNRAVPKEVGSAGNLRTETQKPGAARRPGRRRTHRHAARCG